MGNPIKKKKSSTKSLTSSEQAALNKEWEKTHGTKVAKGENVSISESDYKAWKKRENFAMTYNPAPKPTPRQEVTANLPTKKASTIESKRPSVTKLPKSKKEEDQKFKPEPKTKKLTSGGKQVFGSNIATGVKNVVNKAKFEKEKKQSAAGKRALVGEGGRSSYSKENIATLKAAKKDIKSVKKQVGRTAVRSAVKDINAGIKYEKKVLKNKNVYKR